MKDFMEALTGKADLPKLANYLLLLGIFLVVSLVTHIQQYTNTYGSVYAKVKDVRMNLAESLRKLPLSFFGKRDIADLTETIMGDVNTLEHVWSHVLGYLYGAYISTAVIAIGLLFMSWQLTIAALWAVPVAFMLLFGTRKLVMSRSARTRKAALTVSDSMQEMLECAREIRVTNKEADFLKQFNEKVDTHERVTLSGELFTGIFVNGASVIMRLGMATTILAGTSMILAGTADFMILFMFLMVITRIYAPFDQSLALIAEMFMSQVSAGRIREIYDTPVATGSEDFEPKGHDIVFDKVSFAYEDEGVLKNVSFTAKEGEVTALVGASGSGKSTCARLAARLWDARSGKITLGGVDVQTVDPEVLLRDYSVVFQDVTLFDDTVMENIRLGKRDASDAEVLAAAKAANCDEFIRNLPQGYLTNIGENGSKLSGGERQRISIARALLKNAPVVILDEATASLDVENETRVQGALTRLLAGKTVLVIAHRMRTIENADKVVVMNDGRVVEIGSPADLKTRKTEFAHMLQLQTESANWVI
ncbi:ATP-binding cassette, subfamily B [Lachnospiraceae bacterium XBB1006]|nr:ATP-binding cassette, subfamily B [Lachnospiraceae bacterium XBB1006]